MISDRFRTFLHESLSQLETNSSDAGNGNAITIAETIAETLYTLGYNLGDLEQLQKLADSLQLDTPTLTAVIMGERPVTVDIAQTLETVTQASAEMWMELPATR